MNPDTGYDAIKLSLADTIRGLMQLRVIRNEQDEHAGWGRTGS
jgi:hypothetical protein